MRAWCIAPLAFLAMVCPGRVTAYDIPNHIDMARAAAQQSVIATDSSFMNMLGLTTLSSKLPSSPPSSDGADSDTLGKNRCWHGTKYVIIALVACGGGFEDEPDTKSVNHFFDPTPAAGGPDGVLAEFSGSIRGQTTILL